PEMKRLRHLPIIWGPTPSRVATTALLGSRSHARTIFARNVSAAGSERDRVIATSCVRSSLEIVSIAFGRPVRIGYLLPSGYPKPCNNYATNLRDRTLGMYSKMTIATVWLTKEGLKRPGNSEAVVVGPEAGREIQALGRTEALRI